MSFQWRRNTRLDRGDRRNPPFAGPAKLCADGKEIDMLYQDIKNRVVEWVRLRTAAHRLHHLDNRLLADLGIEREHIDDLVTGRCAR